jgi:RNA polymerase sigma-70 factor (ECF subfamily)
MGPDHVGRFLLGVIRKAHGDLQVSLVELNGLPAIRVGLGNGRFHSFFSIAVSEDGHITGIYALRNPDKLRHLPS